jgi:hypothetical protein
MPLGLILAALSLECGASLLYLLPYPQGFLGSSLIVDGLDRAILEESVLIDPTALVVTSNDVPDHFD